jgi:hypothetical protein
MGVRPAAGQPARGIDDKRSVFDDVALEGASRRCAAAADAAPRGLRSRYDAVSSAGSSPAASSAGCSS